MEGVSLGFLPKFQFQEMHPNHLKFHLRFSWVCVPSHGSIGLNFPALHQGENSSSCRMRLIQLGIWHSSCKTLAWGRIYGLCLKPLSLGLFRGGTGLLVKTWDA